MQGFGPTAVTGNIGFALDPSQWLWSLVGMTKTTPDFAFELAAMAKGARAVAGVDEVGRGPLAGPVCAAAVILDPDNIPDGLNDSKKVGAKMRDALFDQLMACADVSIAEATVAEIDTHNILRASHIAMVRAINGLSALADFILIDGNMIPRGLTTPSQTIVKGDMRSLSIAASSICGQSVARPADGGFGATASGLWVGHKRRIPDTCAQKGTAKTWGDRSP